MDFSLSDQQYELIYRVRELMNTRVKAGAASSADERWQSFDPSLIRLLGEQNLVCPTIPKEFGGLGLDRFTTALVIEEIAAALPGLAAVVDATLHAAEPILLGGSKKQKEVLLPPLTGKDAGIAAFALTEGTGGSDLSLMNTCAVKTDSGFLINGSKDYVINARFANFVVLVAVTNPAHKKSSMRIFLVSADTPGYKMGKNRNTSGMNYTPVSEIIFDEACIDIDMVIKEQEAGSGYLLLTQTFDLGRALVGATSVGIARAAYETALAFAEERIQFGHSIKKHQAIAYELANMATQIEMARLITWKACWLIDRGGDYTVASAMAKLAASTIAQQVSYKAADIMGARAYEKGSFIEQLVRDARVLSTIEGTNNMQRQVIASLL